MPQLLDVQFQFEWDMHPSSSLLHPHRAALSYLTESIRHDSHPSSLPCFSCSPDTVLSMMHGTEFSGVTIFTAVAYVRKQTPSPYSLFISKKWTKTVSMLAECVLSNEHAINFNTFLVSFRYFHSRANISLGRALSSP